MLPRANYYHTLGYNLFLINFPGSGGSNGSKTTIGYEESSAVKCAYEHIANTSSLPIILHGTSMGSVAIIKAMDDFDLSPIGLVLECPFESLYQTSVNRFELMNIPSFPAAQFLVFWGGIQSGFNGFAFKPYEYAKSITMPSLLIYGSKDKRVKRFEIDHIQENIPVESELLILPNAGHANFLEAEPELWKTGISNFVDKLKQGNQ